MVANLEHLFVIDYISAPVRYYPGPQAIRRPTEGPYMGASSPRRYFNSVQGYCV